MDVLSKKESGRSFKKKREVRQEELKKNEGAILMFVNISSGAISRNEMHEVSSASTSKSIPEVEEQSTPGRIRNNEEADVESNISKAYAAKVGKDDITILRNVSCSSVFFNPFAAAEPSATDCVAHETLCNDPNVYIATTV